MNPDFFGGTHLRVPRRVLYAIHLRGQGRLFLFEVRPLALDRVRLLERALAHFLDVQALALERLRLALKNSQRFIYIMHRRGSKTFNTFLTYL